MLRDFIAIILICQISVAQEYEGYWKTVDKNGVAKSIVKLYLTKEGLIEGKVYKILKDAERDKLCKYCKGDKKNKPIEGMVIIENMKPEGDIYVDGQVTHPQNGKVYSCKLWIDKEDKDILNIRGYWAIFYKTQQWERVEDLKNY